MLWKSNFIFTKFLMSWYWYVFRIEMLTCPLKILYFLLLNYYVDVFGELSILNFVPWGTAIIWKHFTEHVFIEIFELNLEVIMFRKQTNLKSFFWVDTFSWMLSLTIMIIIIWKTLCAFHFFSHRLVNIYPRNCWMLMYSNSGFSTAMGLWFLF